MIKLELLVGVVTFALWVFCLIDVVSSDEGAIRNLQKTWWLLLVLFFPLVGSIAWLAAGRPLAGPAHHGRPDFPEYDRPGRFVATDDSRDEEFLKGVRERAEEQRRRYDAERRRRAEEERGDA